MSGCFCEAGDLASEGVSGGTEGRSPKTWGAQSIAALEGAELLAGGFQVQAGSDPLGDGVDLANGTDLAPDAPVQHAAGIYTCALPNCSRLWHLLKPGCWGSGALLNLGLILQPFLVDVTSRAEPRWCQGCGIGGSSVLARQGDVTREWMGGSRVLSRGVSGWCLHYSAVLPQNLLRLWLVFASCHSGDRDSWRRDDAGERVTKHNKGKRRDTVISCCDVILININYIENSMYYNT